MLSCEACLCLVSCAACLPCDLTSPHLTTPPVSRHPVAGLRRDDDHAWTSRWTAANSFHSFAPVPVPHALAHAIDRPIDRWPPAPEPDSRYTTPANDWTLPLLHHLLLHGSTALAYLLLLSCSRATRVTRRPTARGHWLRDLLDTRQPASAGVESTSYNACKGKAYLIYPSHTSLLSPHRLHSSVALSRRA